LIKESLRAGCFCRLETKRKKKNSKKTARKKEKSKKTACNIHVETRKRKRNKEK